MAFIWLIESNKYVSATIIFSMGVFALFSLFHYVENTNRKLTRFIEAIKYDDFIIGFDADNKVGKSFRKLNHSMKEVLDAFRHTRKENEENLQFLDTLVKNVQVGILSYDDTGEVGLINHMAKKLLALDNLAELNELSTADLELYNLLKSIPTGGNTLYRKNELVHLAIHTSRLRIRGRELTLVSLQNIRSELQQNELEAWQNLTKVLRHEIMNSVTPISSLVSTLKEMFEEETHEDNTEQMSKETIGDINEALQAIENRSHALKKFVNAYRDFTQIPKPSLRLVKISQLFTRMENLHMAEVKAGGVELITNLGDKAMVAVVDDELLEMVLINLLKNAIEALKNQPNAKVIMRGYMNDQLRPIIEVEDNGPGIIPEAIDGIFIPFYTTKPTGSGIGLSLSRQIIHMHGGTLTVESEVGEKTVFKIEL
jgi:two-component system, NtrC family, nitrogen regulation sensor histidine kinase NtrY